MESYFCQCDSKSSSSLSHHTLISRCDIVGDACDIVGDTLVIVCCIKRYGTSNIFATKQKFYGCYIACHFATVNNPNAHSRACAHTCTPRYICTAASIQLFLIHLQILRQASVFILLLISFLLSPSITPPLSLKEPVHPHY